MGEAGHQSEDCAGPRAQRGDHPAAQPARPRGGGRLRRRTGRRQPVEPERGD